MGDSEIPVRLCNGGPHGKWCGAVATVVCTETPETTAFVLGCALGPLQWFACDNVDHQEHAKTEPFADWYRREVLERRGPVQTVGGPPPTFTGGDK